MSSPQNVSIVYNPRAPQAESLARQLADKLGIPFESCIASTFEQGDRQPPPSTSLIITVGGDGTILWAAQMAAPHGIPILGVNLGRVGFMTELKAEEAVDRVGEFLDGGVWVEERSMLQAWLSPGGAADETEQSFHALNDVVVGRNTLSRVVHLEVHIDGALFTTYRADGVIVATATGSTGYSISAGGPILHPQSRDLLINPVATHLGLHTPIVLSPDSIVDVTLRSDYEATLSVDGRMDVPLEPGTVVHIARSPQVATFLRSRPPNQFYATLTERLSPDFRSTAPRGTYFT